MARYRYAGGDQRPDAFGVLTPGDVLELAEMPEWGKWETTTKKADQASTPQPVADDEPTSAADTETEA
jgi:hypothetical protein